MKHLHTIKHIKAAMGDPSTALTREYMESDLFEARRDLSVWVTDTTLTVCFLAVNNLHAQGDEAPGLNRQLTASLSSITTGKVLSSATKWANIRRGISAKEFRLDLHLSANDINFDDGYVVTITDTQTKTPLGSKTVIFYDERDHLHTIATEWAVEGASIAPYHNHSGRKFRSIKASDSECCKVRFDLYRHTDRLHASEFPEMEIRIYFPDGTMQSSFNNIAHDDYDAVDVNRYYAEMPFTATLPTMGICYAELRCLESVIHGFAFSTDDDEVEGVWPEDCLQILDGNNFKLITDYYHSAKEKLALNRH